MSSWTFAFVQVIPLRPASAKPTTLRIVLLQGHLQTSPDFSVIQF